MAKPMSPTPIITGKAARRIQREIVEGTPNTRKRIATIKRAVEVFRRTQGR